MAEAHVVRCYVATSPDAVRRWRAAGGLPAGTRVTAVTRAVRDAVGPGDEEEYEYAAALAAIDLVAAGLAAPDAPGALVVLAADAAPALLEPDPDAGDAALRVREDVPVRRWAALFVVAPGDDGDPDLAWYDVSELDAIG